MAGDPRQRLGVSGERAAEQLLVRGGMSILARRFRSRYGEVDLIAEQEGTIVFVEVKARGGGGYGKPAEAITAAKRRRIVRTAADWLQRTGRLHLPCRFDVVSVTAAPGGGVRVEHLPAAFRPQISDGRFC